MSFVNLTDLTGAVYAVNPELVASLTDAQTTPAGVYVDIQGDAPTRIVAAGTVASVAAALNAGLSGGASSGEYTPTFSGIGGQVAGVVAPSPWRWQRIGNVVLVQGESFAALNPGPGNGVFEADVPFPIAPSTAPNFVAAMSASPPTPAPEAPVSPFGTPTSVGYQIAVTGLYPTARVMASFVYEAA